MLRPLSLLPLLSLSLAVTLSLLLTWGSGANAAQKSCRSCDCTVTLSNNLNYDGSGPGDYTEQDKVVDQLLSKLTGGDSYRWTTRPKAVDPSGKQRRDEPSERELAHGTPTGPLMPRGSGKMTGGLPWKGEAYFYRLCGNGGKVTAQYNATYWHPLDRPTVIDLDCKCHNSVVCKKGSQCQKSGIS